MVSVGTLAATSINLSPVNVSVKAGQTFTVGIVANPQGVKNYTVETKLNFPADLLQVQSFVFNAGWMPVTQPGYDLIDNTNGVLVKTAGYPQGFNSAAQFGTVTFKAKKDGSGSIGLVNGTAALDQSGQNVYSGSSQVNVSITSAAATPAPTARPTPRPVVSPARLTGQTNATTVTVAPSPVVTESSAPSPSTPVSDVQQASLLGAIGNVSNLGTGSWIVSLIVLLALIALVYWLIQRARRPKSPVDNLPLSGGQ